MRKIMFISLYGLLFGLLFGVVGCGGSVTTYTYFYPNWTPDGNIVCVKLKSTSSNAGGFGGSPSTSFTNEYYLTIMNEYGSNEVDVVKIPQLGKVAASPLGNYYAYSQDNVINVITTQGASVSCIDCSFEVQTFDWSPNDTMLVFATTNGAFVIDINKNNKSIIGASGSMVAWRNGNWIVMHRPLTTEVSRLVALNTVDYLEVAYYPNILGGEFNISTINTNEVVFRGDKIEKFYLNSPEATPSLLIDRSDLWNIRLSPAANKIVASGSNTSGAEIWMINIDGTEIKQLR